MNRVVGIVLLVVGSGCHLKADDWPTVKTGIRLRYPDVEELTTAELSAWHARSDEVQPILLDARAAAEFAVSHLAGAVHASTLDDAVTALAGAALDTPVVAYCSVGYRSAGLADGLGQRGYTRVYNLEGSLFQWANEGRPLVDADGPVNVVHPYGEPWSDLLDEARRGPDPAAPPR